MSNQAYAKERPILFSAPMVRAILDGRKTQTRRVIKPQPEAWRHDSKGWELLRTPDCRPVFPDTFAKHYRPYGRQGDRLWVRERWAANECYDGIPPREIPAGDAIWYAGPRDGTAHERDGNTLRNAHMGRWRPSIHMPRWASRITLEITGVRVERLQDISEADARAEGVDETIVLPGDRGSFVASFAYLWHQINGEKSWDANPWVWALEFKRIDDRRRS